MLLLDVNRDRADRMATTVSYLYIEIQKRLSIEAVLKTTSIALYMSHSHTENSQCPLRITLIALKTIAPIDTDRSTHYNPVLIIRIRTKLCIN